MNLRQAVILCGGLGTRLRPITYKIPKPMVNINGKPFLEYLIEQLKDNGIDNILLLTGYKKEIIENYFGDGSKFGVSISYSHGDVDWDTGRRLYIARDLIDDYFFLLYCDNFVQYNLEKLKYFYLSKIKDNISVSFVVFSKKEKNNIKIDEQTNLVLDYDKDRINPDLKYVELGCMIINKKIFSLFDETNFSFSDILKKLVDKKELFGYITKDQYYSISDQERLKLTEEYLKNKKIIILDRDGTINKKAPKGEYINKWEKFEFLPGVLESLKLLSKKGYKFIIISNQAGIATGGVNKQDLDIINNNMLNIFKEYGVDILKIYICPHHWEEKCGCRKPNPGMLLQASKDFKFRLDKTFIFGDDERDVLAAYNANAIPILIGNNYSREWMNKYKEEYNNFKYTHIADIKEAVEYVIKTTNKN